jgi:AcrR family transcriptional regulator
MAPRRAAAIRHLGDHGATLSDHLLATTDHLLEDTSLGALTTRRIARAAGVSDGVIYNHFPDKQALILRALLRRYARLVDRFELAAPVAGEGSVTRQLQAFAHALSDLEADVLLLGAGLLADPALLEALWSEIHRVPFGIGRLRQPLIDYLAAERDRGTVDLSIDVEAVATLVFGASGIVALTRRVNAHTDRAALDAQLDAAIVTIVVGIEPRTAR